MAASSPGACGKVGFQNMEEPCTKRSAAAYPNGTGVFLGGRYSEKDVISYGGISEKSQLGVRSSNRIRAQPNADSSIMERAQQQASARDPSSFSGTKHLNKFSLSSFSNDEVVDMAAVLGVSLGKNSSQVMHSIDLLKETDIARNLFLKQNEVKELCSMDDNDSLVLDEATILSQDLIEEEKIDVEIHKELSNKAKSKVKSTRKKTKEVKLPCRQNKRLENNH
jgi:hypothetical protein